MSNKTENKKNGAVKDIKRLPKLPPKLKMEWEEKTVSITDLKPFEKNPREVTEGGMEKLRRSMLENGYHQRIACTRDFRVIGGHRRLDVLKEFGFKKIKVVMPKRDITDKEFKQIMIRDNIEYFEFDVEIAVAEFGAENLVSWGMDAKFILGNEETKDVSFKAAKKDDKVKCPSCGHKFKPEKKKKD